MRKSRRSPSSHPFPPPPRPPVWRRPPIPRRTPTEPGTGRATLRASSPADLMGIVPYLLGFHPADSLVLLLLGEREIVMTARMDVATLQNPRALAEYLDQLRRGQHAGGLVTITYSADPFLRDLTVALAAELDPQVLVDALVADGERWWSVCCDGACCPSEGTPYGAGSTPISAAAVYAGLAALPDRAAVQALVVGPSPTEEDRLADLADTIGDELAGSSAGTRKRLVRRLVERHLAERGSPLSDDDCLRLSLLVFDVRVRDVAWALLSRERAHEHVELWRQVVARSPEWLATAPLCLLGMAAWVSGNGALQNCCLERLEEIDPTCSMASLLADISLSALPPSAWDRLAGEFRRHPDILTG